MHCEKQSFWLLLSALIICSVTGRSSGPPLSPNADFDLVCNALTPSPTAHGSPSAGDGGYRLEISPPMTPATNGFTYSPNTVYTGMTVVSSVWIVGVRE